MATTKQNSGNSEGKVPPRAGNRSARPAPAEGGAVGATATKAAVPPRPRQSGASTPRPGARPQPRVSARQLAQRRRQRNIYMAVGSAGAVIVVVVVIIAVSLSGGAKKTPTTPGLALGEYNLPANLIAKVEAVPVKQLVKAALSAGNSAMPPQALPKGNALLTSDGKPEILYIGAEYCPYCAAERWAMVMAFSKFGTFSGVHGTSSSATDVNPSTPTFAFYRSRFTSKYITFTPVETLANDEKTTLQTPTSAEEALITKWDQPPYVQNSQLDGSIPFIYLGGKYLQIGASYDAAKISGMNFTQAASYMTSGHNATSKAAMATAAYLVGDVCALTHGQPASVCSQVPKSLIGITTSSPTKGQTSNKK